MKDVTPPPEVAKDGGLSSRIFGVPGSTPGCTAGAYSRPFDSTELPDISFKTCFPDHYTLAKKWFTDEHPKSLQLLLTSFGPAPSIADVVNKWLIRRVGRKCAEGTEEGRKDMEAFCVDAVKRLRKLPTSTMTLYRPVPWSAMGKSAPGLSEFEEEFNIVWPTFTSLTRNVKYAKELFKEEGGILFVVTTDQARDVTDASLAPTDNGEYMLEPNSCFTITKNENQGKLFVVEMKQNYPSLRPILSEAASKPEHHHSHPATIEKKSDSISQSFSQGSGTRAGDNATVVTPVLRRAPSASSTPLKGKSGVFGSGSLSARLPTSPSRFMTPTKKTPMRVAHRTEANIHQPAVMTMWSAGCGYLRILSCSARGRNVKPFTPKWASKDKEEKKEESTEEGKKEEKEEGKESKEGKEGKEGKKKKKEKKHKKKKDKEASETSETAEQPAVTPVDTAAVPSVSAPDEEVHTPTSAPGYGTMALYPNAAPTYIIDETSMDWRSIGGIIFNTSKPSPKMVISLK